MPALRGGVGARVVTLSSIAAIGAQIRLDDPNFEHRHYNPATAYRQAELSNQVFALELDRRLRPPGSKVLSVLAHPGYTATGLSVGMARTYGNRAVRSAILAIHHAGEFLLSQNVGLGALPELYAPPPPTSRAATTSAPAASAASTATHKEVRPVRAAATPSPAPPCGT